MSVQKLEQRVAELEKEVAALKAALDNRKDWRRTVGMFAGDEVMKRIDEEGRKIREAERRKLHEKPKKRSRAKS
jgi:hypothetical protein